MTTRSPKGARKQLDLNQMIINDNDSMYCPIKVNRIESVILLNNKHVNLYEYRFCRDACYQKGPERTRS